MLVPGRCPEDRFDPPCHLLRGTSSECEQENSFRADTRDDQVCHAVRKGHRFAGARTRDHQQRARLEPMLTAALAVFRRKSLCRVQDAKVVKLLLRKLHARLPQKSVFLYSTGCIYKVGSRNFSIASARARGASKCSIWPAPSMATLLLSGNMSAAALSK